MVQQSAKPEVSHPSIQAHTAAAPVTQVTDVLLVKTFRYRFSAAKKRDLPFHQLQHMVQRQVSHWLPCDDVCISKYI